MDRASLCSFTYATIHGPLTISATAKGICAIEFGQGPGEGRHVATELTNRAANQMQEYLAGKRRSFDVPLDIEGDRKSTRLNSSHRLTSRMPSSA